MQRLAGKCCRAVLWQGTHGCVKVPLPDAEGKVLYVWFDGPIGYISATKELTDQWANYWWREDSKLVHFVGKTILYFIVSFSRPCWKPMEVLCCRIMYLPMNFWILKVTKYLPAAIGPCGCMNTWKTFPVVKMCCAIHFVPMPRKQKTMISPGRISRTGTIVNWLTSSEILWTEPFCVDAQLCGGKVPKLHKDILDDNDKVLMADIESTGPRLVCPGILSFPGCLVPVIDLSRKRKSILQKKEPWIVAKTISGDPDVQKSMIIVYISAYSYALTSQYLSIHFYQILQRKMLYMMKWWIKCWIGKCGKLDLLRVGYSLREPQFTFQKNWRWRDRLQIENWKSGLVKPADEKNKLQNGRVQTSNQQPKPVSSMMTSQNWVEGRNRDGLRESGESR